MSHNKWLVTYSLRDDVTAAQHDAFYDICSKADKWIVAREKSGKEHCHAYLEYSKPIQYVQLQRKFGALHKDSKYSLQIKKAYNYGALEYVVKEGRFVTNLSPEELEAGKDAAKISKKKEKRGDIESVLFEFCEYLEERGGTGILLRSPDRLELQQLWKDFCAYKKEWVYVDKSFVCLRRLEYGAEVLWSKWTDHQKASALHAPEVSADPEAPDS